MKILLMAFLFLNLSCKAQKIIVQPPPVQAAGKSDSLKILFAMIKNISVAPKNDSVKILYNIFSTIAADITTLNQKVGAINQDSIYIRAYGTGTKTDPFRFEP